MIRLFVENKISVGQEFSLNEKQVHYLFHVMKSQPNDYIYCFDNLTGEYDCKIITIGKKNCTILAVEKLREFERVKDIWLLFAPVKKDNTDFIVEKATELGVRKIIPVITKRTNADKVRVERLQAQSIEASEQSRRVDLAEVKEAVSFDKILTDWPIDRDLYFMDETLEGGDVYSVFTQAKNDKIAILTGPEGGFSPDELNFLRKLPFAKAVSLGKRILRAETAALAALSCWQAINGDWRQV